MCSNCLFKPKVLIHLQVVRGRVRLLVESNFESVSKAGVRGMGQVVLGRSSSLFVPGTSEDGNDFFIFRWNVNGRFSKFWDEDALIKSSIYQWGHKVLREMQWIRNSSANICPSGIRVIS